MSNTKQSNTIPTHIQAHPGVNPQKVGLRSNKLKGTYLQSITLRTAGAQTSYLTAPQ